MCKKICFLLLFITISYGCQREDVKKFKWKLQVQSPEANLDYSEILKMAKKIKVMSSGQLDITVYPGGAKAITKGPKIFDGVKEGTTEMAAGWPNWWLKNDNAWAILQGSPYLFMNFATISIIIFTSAVSFYMFFLILGVGGIAKNRSAQGLDQKSSK